MVALLRQLFENILFIIHHIDKTPHFFVLVMLVYFLKKKKKKMEKIEVRPISVYNCSGFYFGSVIG